jgi:hypothetical protein
VGLGAGAQVRGIPLGPMVHPLGSMNLAPPSCISSGQSSAGSLGCGFEETEAEE